MKRINAVNVDVKIGFEVGSDVQAVDVDGKVRWLRAALNELFPGASVEVAIPIQAPKTLKQTILYNLLTETSSESS